MPDEISVSIPEHELDALLSGQKDAIRVPESYDGLNTTPISDVAMDEEHDLLAVVRQVNDVNVFDRDDGDEGRVRNIRIQDRTGDIRCALWGEHADVPLEIGDYVHVVNAQIEDGYQDHIEASVGWDSSIYVVDEADAEQTYVTVTLEEDD